MKNYVNSCLKPACYCLAFIAQIALTSFNMPTPGENDGLKVEIAFDGCSAIITTAISDLEAGASSGLFYRLEHASGSYFWKQDTMSPTPENAPAIISVRITKSIDNLPNGTYTVTCYQTRKNKPIRVKKSISVYNSNNVCIPNLLPRVVDGSGNIPPVWLTASWNAFTNRSLSVPVDTHHTANFPRDTTPRDPWFFIALSASDIKPYIPIRLEFNHESLEYYGAIFNDFEDPYPHNFSVPSPWPEVSNIEIKPDGALEIKFSSNFKSSNQKNIYLIFKRKNAILDTLESVKFTGSYDNYQATVVVPVTGAPHDPNSLHVSEELLCACQPGKVLKYKVSVQNIGTAPVEDIKIKLLHTLGLKMSTLRIISPSASDLPPAPTPPDPNRGITYEKHAEVVFVPDTLEFSLNNIFLPGSNQPNFELREDETWDWIEFEIKTNDCLENETMIQPIARVTFVGVPGYLDTNIGATRFSSRICGGKEEPDCKKCRKKIAKRCKLFSWLTGD